MALDADRSLAILTDVRDRTYSHCRVCGSENEQGMQLKFRPWGEAGVTADFDCRAAYQGYDEVLHGGVICAMLDSASVNCLFVHQITAVTAALDVRFREVVKTGIPATVRAWLVKSTHGLHVVASELDQEGRVKVTGTAKFLLRQ
jgi:acyl-coenzyme A thioesterase PaaI-like protein